MGLSEKCVDSVLADPDTCIFTSGISKMAIKLWTTPGLAGQVKKRIFK